MPPPRPSRRALRLVGGVFLIGAVGFSAWTFGRREIDRRISAQSTELSAINQLKSLQMSEWYRERQDDALGRAADPFLVASVRDWVAGRREPELTERIRVALAPRREPWRYLNIWLLTVDGQTLFDARRQGVAADLEPGLLQECLTSRLPVFGIMRNLGTATPFLDLCMAVVELRDPGSPPAGVQVYRVDAAQLVLPTVRFWSQAGVPGITSVLRVDGDRPQVVVSSSSLALPGMTSVIVPPGLITTQSSNRQAARVTGTDGRARLVATERVTGTPWTVVTAVDREDVLRQSVEEIVLVAFLALTLGVAAYLAYLLLLTRRDQDSADQVFRFDRLLRVRSAINEAIARIRDRDQMLSRFCEIAVSLGRFELAVVYGWHPDRSTARILAFHGALPERLAGLREIPVDDVLKSGPMAPLYTGGQVAIVPDLRNEAPNAWTERLLQAGHRALVAIPIREKETVIGSFWLYSKEAGVFDRQDARLFDELADDIKYALESVASDKQRRSAEVQLQAVFDAAPFAMFLIDRHELRIDRVNGAAIRQYGYSDEELVGQSAARIFAGEDLVPSAPIGDGGAVLPVTTNHRRKDGALLKVEVSTRPVEIDGQTHDVVVAMDVTERRQLEEQYRQSQRLEAVGKLAGGIAHDFNNLLTVIGGFAAFVLEDLAPDAPGRKAAEQIQIAANRASELTRSMLAFSRRQVLNTKHLSLSAVVRETSTMLSRLISEDVVLNLKLDAKRDTVNVDPAQMQQVIMNLAVNARDAMKKGGRITIATRDLDDRVELSVSDTGHGIEPEVLEHIFEPFFTTKPSGEGTGLGLPTVHGIVTQSGGAITVNTEVGRGTTFIITLPRVEQASDGDVVPDAATPAPAGRGTVMLVEDDAGVRALATIILNRGGYQVIECTNGAAALDRATSSQLPIDLLVTDVVMPGMSGPELVGRLLSYYPNLPILYMSGYAEDAANRLGINLRSLDLLHKPFAPQEFLKRVNAAISRGR